MSDIVTFQNPGLIPMEAVTTMGVSAKEGDNPIGFFGTGLKYAIASLLRTGQKITIWRGLDRYDFKTQTGEVRGKEFDFIHMIESSVNGALDGPSHRLGFTTHLGARWEMWQVFRELHSNALDEGGTSVVARLEPREGYTTIQARGTQIVDAAAKRSQIFLETKPIATLDGLAIHPEPSHRLYYRGVQVMGLSKPSAFTYNVLSPMELTEDRTLKYPWAADSTVAAGLRQCGDIEILEKALTNKKGFEDTMSFRACSDSFYETVLLLIEKLGILALNASAVASAGDVGEREGPGAKGSSYESGGDADREGQSLPGRDRLLCALPHHRR